MRDPGTEAKVEAALKDTHRVFGFLSRLGALREGVEDDPDADIRSEARIWLTLDSNPRMPDDIRGYLLWLVRDWECDPAEEIVPPIERKPKRLARPPRNTIRDHWIVDMIAYLRDEFEINPTRNRESFKQASGCSIVAKVLKELGIKLSESGVADLWRHLHNEAEPDHVPKQIELPEERQRSIDLRLRQLKELDLGRKTVRDKRPHLSRMTRKQR